jgi:hypothetical protein
VDKAGTDARSTAPQSPTESGGPLQYGAKNRLDKVPLKCYIGNMVTSVGIDRTQTGVRIATPLLKVLKGLAEYKNLSLGDLLEGIVLHSFEGKSPFSEETLATIGKLREIYGCALTSADSHQHPQPDE